MAAQYRRGAAMREHADKWKVCESAAAAGYIGRRLKPALQAGARATQRLQGMFALRAASNSAGWKPKGPGAVLNFTLPSRPIR
jgi:hypothetical protein